jgi:molybdenum cofactor cytidylyltransferase
VNRQPERGMFSSVRLGIAAAIRSAGDDAAPGAPAEFAPDAAPAGLLLFPVDHPRVTAGTVAALVRALPEKPAATWLRPVHEGRGGHPILLDGATAIALLERDPDEPLRDALRGLGLTPQDVPVDDPGILANLNRPEDLG